MNDPRRWERFLPGIGVLRRYERAWLRGDVIAGITVAAYLVPQVMAYAVIVGLPSVVGLWAILLPLALYAILGSSRQLSIGPEASTALMTAAGIGALVGAVGPGRHAEVAAIFAIAVGLVCLVGWVMKLGFLAALLSRPVLVGYMAGIGILMIISQLGKVIKVELNGGHPVLELWHFAQALPDAHLPTAGLALLLLALLFLGRRVLPTWPTPLIALSLGAALVALFGLERFGIETIGTVPAGLPAPECPVSGTSRCGPCFPSRRASRWWATRTTS